MWQYVSDVESLVLYNYRIDPYTMEQNMTILDFQLMVRRLSENAKKEEEDRKRNLSGDKVADALVAVRDILNYITLPKSKRP